MGGTNDSDNLVELTAKEHFIIHKLVCEIYPENRKLVYALSSMMLRTNSLDNDRSYNICSTEYQRLKELRSKLGRSEATKKKISNNHARYWKGKESPRKGKRGIDGKGKGHSEATKQKIRDAAKNNPNYGRRGKPTSEETRRKMSAALKGRPGKHGFDNPAYKHVDKNLLTKMIINGCSLKEILLYFNISDTTLYRKYELYYNCKNHGEIIKLFKPKQR